VIARRQKQRQQQRQRTDDALIDEHEGAGIGLHRHRAPGRRRLRDELLGCLRRRLVGIARRIGEIAAIIIMGIEDPSLGRRQPSQVIQKLGARRGAIGLGKQPSRRRQILGLERRQRLVERARGDGCSLGSARARLGAWLRAARRLRFRDGVQTQHAKPHHAQAHHGEPLATERPMATCRKREAHGSSPLSYHMHRGS
jgi:hypothetical protein